MGGTVRNPDLAIESAGGLGYLLAQQLVAAGEIVLDVPATLASRARLLARGRSNKNDPNDAHSVAVAALRSRGLRRVEPADHSDVLRLLAKRNTGIGNHRTRLVTRPHHAVGRYACSRRLSPEQAGYTFRRTGLVLASAGCCLS